MDPLASGNFRYFFLMSLCPCSGLVYSWYTPQLPSVDFSESSKVYCQLQRLVSLFLTLSLPVDISKDPETFQTSSAANAAVQTSNYFPFWPW